ncbi:MAG: peptidylprolyl isomerase [Ilumatobacteraceae bacterium]
MEMMLRRTQFRIAGAIALVALSACSSAVTTSAARIGDDRLSVDDFELTVQQLGDAGQLDIVNGRVSGESSRSVLGALLRGMATTQMLDIYGEPVTDADRKVVLDQLEQDSQTALLGPELKELIVSLNSEDLALQRVEVPDMVALAETYAKEPAKLGAMCMRHILVADESTAKKVINLYNDGEDFAQLAGTYSTEPGATTSGGILGSATSECLALAEIQTGFDAGFTAGALRAKENVAYGPVKSSFGWHVILIRPFDEIADPLNALLSVDPGNTLLTGYLATADISIKSSYGRWNPPTGQIVAN